jgi:hypothetical protein
MAVFNVYVNYKYKVWTVSIDGQQYHQYKKSSVAIHVLFNMWADIKTSLT